MGRKKHPEPLTPAEQRVLEELRSGATNAEIAVRLGLSINTVKYHVANMLAKTGLTDRSELRDWKMPRERGRFGGWPMRAAVGLGAVGVVVAVVGILAFPGDGSERDRDARVAYSAGSGAVPDRVAILALLSGKRDEIVLPPGSAVVSHSWAPDGGTIAVGELSESTGLPVVALYEAPRWELLRTIDDAAQAFWSPDGERIVTLGLERVALLRKDGSELASLDSPASGTSGNPQWNAESSKFVVLRQGRLIVGERDGSMRFVEQEALGLPVRSTSAVPFGFLNRVELLLWVGDSRPVPPKTFAYNLESGASREIDDDESGLLGPESLTDLQALATRYPNDFPGVPAFSADGRARFYLLRPTTHGPPPAELRVVIVSGDGFREVTLTGLGCCDRTGVGVVLVGDWPDPPPLAAPSP